MAAAIAIRRLAGDEEAQQCARIMADSEPWLMLGRSYEACLTVLRNREHEVHVALDKGDLAGFIIIDMRGPFIGYIRTVAVDDRRRGGGIGTALVEFAEQRIFRESPNAFLCVSSFNRRARALYERLGYELVGELRDYIVRGHAELLMRKTRGPLTEFSPS